MTILFSKFFKKRHKKQQYKTINCVKFFVENISKSDINYGDVVIFGGTTGNFVTFSRLDDSIIVKFEKLPSEFTNTTITINDVFYTIDSTLTSCFVVAI